MNKNLIDNEVTDEYMKQLFIENLSSKVLIFFFPKVIFFIFGFILLSNTIVIYGYTYGKYWLEDHILQFFFFFMGFLFMYISIMFQIYSNLAIKFTESLDIMTFKTLLVIERKVWIAVSAFLLTLVFAILIIVLFTGIRHVDSMFWFFLDI